MSRKYIHRSPLLRKWHEDLGMYSVPYPPDSIWARKKDRTMCTLYIISAGGLEEPINRRWYYSKENETAIEAILRNYGLYVDEAKKFNHENIHAGPAIAEKVRNWAEEFKEITGILPQSELEAKAAYKKAAIRLHPDRGGDSNLMANLNVAYKGLRESKGW